MICIDIKALALLLKSSLSQIRVWIWLLIGSDETEGEVDTRNHVTMTWSMGLADSGNSYRRIMRVVSLAFKV